MASVAGPTCMSDFKAPQKFIFQADFLFLLATVICIMLDSNNSCELFHYSYLFI